MPVQKLETITPESWRAAFATNAEGRMFLTLALLDHFASGARLLFLKSGMSVNPRIGCIQPAASLAASLMMERVLKLELKPRGILVGSTKPGYVLTETMEETLKIPADILPEVNAFKASPMMKPDLSARYLAWMLTSTSDADYVREDWDIADTKHHHHWLGGEPLYK